MRAELQRMGWIVIFGLLLGAVGQSLIVRILDVRNCEIIRTALAQYLQH